jgi:flagellar assembly protein FliH
VVPVAAGVATTMSDMTPLNLYDVLPQRRGFQPRHFEPAAPAASPMAQGAHDDFSAGFAEGQRLAQELFAQERQQLLDLIRNAEALQAEPSEEVAVLIANAVERLLTQLTGQIVPDKAWLEAQVARAVELIQETDAQRRLRLHPDDATLLTGVQLACTIVPDATLQRGEIRVECSSGWVEHGVPVNLARLRTELSAA